MAWSINITFGSHCHFLSTSRILFISGNKYIPAPLGQGGRVVNSGGGVVIPKATPHSLRTACPRRPDDSYHPARPFIVKRRVHVEFEPATMNQGFIINLDKGGADSNTRVLWCVKMMKRQQATILITEFFLPCGW